jgi:hypothetical protein
MLDPTLAGPSGRGRRPRPLLRTMVGDVLRRTRREQGRTLAELRTRHARFERAAQAQPAQPAQPVQRAEQADRAERVIQLDSIRGDRLAEPALRHQGPAATPQCLAA